MARQSVQEAFLVWTIAILSVTFSCIAVEEEGFALCVTSRRRVLDLSSQRLPNVPDNLAKETQYLDISKNPIGTLDGAPFHGLSALCFLKATYCGLKVISPAVFDNTPDLKVLNISHNGLLLIPDKLPTLLKVIDLASNLYNGYQLPATFQTLSHLDVLSLGSENAQRVNYDDFATLSNISLRHLTLGDGVWTRYDRGALSQLKSLQKITLNVSFCEHFEVLENLLKDLNETQAMDLEFARVLPNNCDVIGDPFRNLRTMPFIRNLTIANTFFNSSFMVTFSKNVFISPIRELKLVNITYTEDTQEGYRLLSINQNHTMIRSITFDRVKHYQYRYPKVNVSADIFYNLTYCKFSGSGMNILPCNLLSALPSLETLDLSNNLLTERGFWWYWCTYTLVFPKLKHLFLNMNRFVELSFISEQTQEMKNLESLDLSFNSIVLEEPCFWPTHLTALSLANNHNLGNKVFSYLSPNFERIDLSKTAITVITQEDIARFPRLTHLFLSQNSIKVIPSHLCSPTLLTLYINQNAITSISQYFLEGLPRLKMLKAGNNPFTCSCDSYWFMTTLNKSMLPDWPLDYTCSLPPSATGLPMAEYKTSKLSCEAWLQAALALPVTVVLIAALCFTFYICDGAWYTKMLWVWLRVKRRGHKQANLLRNACYRYHSFISYSHCDSAWVESRLVPSLEGSGLSLCVHGRDFVPGEWIVDNIINCVEASYKTLFVLSNHFVQSEWCNYELFFAQHRAINVEQDPLVFILLEPIPTNSLPRKFLKLRSLLRQQTYLEWPKDELKQQIFWASLRSMLRVADDSILKEVSLSTLETASLITDSF